MAGFDPDVFGDTSQKPAFDPEVFGESKPRQMLTRQQIADQINNDPISQGARAFPSQGSDAFGGASQAALNALTGLVRGAGSIGATLARPFESSAENDQRRARIDQNMQAIGAQPDSWFYQGGKLGGEIAGTAGAGNVLAAPFRAVSALSSRAGVGAIPMLDTVASAMSTGGFKTGAQLPALTDAAVRMGAGAAVGGASAGMVNPEDAGLGAAIGGAIPGITKAMGAAGRGINNMLSSTPGPNQRTLDTARQSLEAGYVIPPNMINPSLTNQVIESTSGKIATQQFASNKNAQVTERLVRDALGLPADVPLSLNALENLRKTAGRAYAEVAGLSPQAASDLEALKQARFDANNWFTYFNTTKNPEALTKAKEFRQLSTDLETALEQHAKNAGKDELIPALRDARREIAKTYTVGRALNDSAGTIDARVLGRLYEKGAPLSDELKTAGMFASAFPTVAKTPQQVGSLGSHNLKSMLSMAGATAAGIGGHAAIGPMGAVAAVPFLAPYMARAQMFSGPVQRGLLSLSSGLPEPVGLLSLGASRSLPVLAAQ